MAYIISYANPHPIYQPAMRIISAMTLSYPMIVTTTFAHQYITGTIVRLDIPLGQGMQQANQQIGPITVTSATTFTIPIDSITFDPLITPTEYPFTAQNPQVVPVGELNSQLTAATLNILNPNN
jgi:hypothetical protein